ncbi:MAG TPA: hypothetical protein VK013_07305 [Myxococcaceae bacterium]|nr:hypothetical protein [Myxococcaceae bacterium]
MIAPSSPSLDPQVASGSPESLIDTPLDRWIRRAAVATLLALALALASTGLILYGAPAEAATAAPLSPTSR